MVVSTHVFLLPLLREFGEDGPFWWACFCSNDGWNHQRPLVFFGSGVCWAGVVSPGLLVTETISSFAAGDLMADCGRQAWGAQGNGTRLRRALFLQADRGLRLLWPHGRHERQRNLHGDLPGQGDEQRGRAAWTAFGRYFTQPYTMMSARHHIWHQGFVTADMSGWSPTKDIAWEGHLANDAPRNEGRPKSNFKFSAMKISRFNPERKESFSLKTPFFMRCLGYCLLVLGSVNLRSQRVSSWAKNFDRFIPSDPGF